VAWLAAWAQLAGCMGSALAEVKPQDRLPGVERLEIVRSLRGRQFGKLETVFAEQGMHAEARKALALFGRAAEEERASAELAQGNRLPLQVPGAARSGAAVRGGGVGEGRAWTAFLDLVGSAAIQRQAPAAGSRVGGLRPLVGAPRVSVLGRGRSRRRSALAEGKEPQEPPFVPVAGGIVTLLAYDAPQFMALLPPADGKAAL
jgi:hypothetical protein